MKTPSLKKAKYINDPVYGGIPITQLELELIDTPIFQRLRGLRQLAHVDYVFPGAEHSRFVHSLGVLYIMGVMTDHLLSNSYIDEHDAIKMRIAALLHDIGHYPLSHLGESVYGYCKDSQIALSVINGLQTGEIPLYQLASSHSKSTHHEQLGKYIVTNHTDIKRILGEYGLDPNEIGEIFTGEIGSKNMIYSQLLHSSLDADRLDYLLRDSYQTGVKYGLVDLQYLIRLLMVQQEDLEGERKVLTCNKKGQHVVEHFLMSRYFHYSQVVFHKTNAAFEGMIKAMYIKLVQNGGFMYSSLEEIQADINTFDFLNFNDTSLDAAFKKYYNATNDEEFKSLYHMYVERIRPKVVFDLKALYEESPPPEFSILKWKLKRYPEEISKIIGSSRWGYQIVPVSIERIHNHYPLTEISEDHAEDLREAVKLFDPESTKITYLAEDRLSVISRLANYKSEFIRIFVLEERGMAYNYDDMRQRIKGLIQS